MQHLGNQQGCDITEKCLAPCVGHVSLSVCSGHMGGGDSPLSSVFLMENQNTNRNCCHDEIRKSREFFSPDF